MLDAWIGHVAFALQDLQLACRPMSLPTRFWPSTQACSGGLVTCLRPVRLHRACRARSRRRRVALQTMSPLTPCGIVV